MDDAMYESNLQQLQRLFVSEFPISHPFVAELSGHSANLRGVEVTKFEDVRFNPMYLA